MRYRSWPDETRPSLSRNQIWFPIPEEKIIPRTNIFSQPISSTQKLIRREWMVWCVLVAYRSLFQTHRDNFLHICAREARVWHQHGQCGRRGQHHWHRPGHHLQKTIELQKWIVSLYLKLYIMGQSFQINKPNHSSLQLQWPGREARQGGDGLEHAPGAGLDDLPGPSDGRLQLRGQVGAGGRGPAGARRQGRHLHPGEAGRVLAPAQGPLARVQRPGVRHTFPADLRPGKLCPRKRQTSWQHRQVRD